MSLNTLRLLAGSVLSAVVAAAATAPCPSNATDLATAHCSPCFLQQNITIRNGGKVFDVSAIPTKNYSLANVSPLLHGAVNFCNVTVTYTHPGFNDTIHINVLLPLYSWNGRFQGVGGGGWATNSGPTSLVPGVAMNYSTGNTDGGHPDNGAGSSSWAFKANGQLNIPLLEGFASVALHDLAVVGKQISHKFYGHGPNKAYWNGCSTGGRQGLMMAQRYPTDYNGIYAASPAIHWETFQVAQYWGHEPT